MLGKYFKDESGATAIEYALVAALLSVALIAGYRAVGNSINDKWDETASAVTGAGSSFLNN